MMIDVSAAIIMHEMTVLIARRGDGKHLAGYWEFPGGKIEPNETAELCLVREIKEELNVSISAPSFFMESIHHYNTKSVCLKAFTCTISRGTIKLCDHDAYEFVPIENLHNFKLAPADIPFVEELQRIYSQIG